MLKAEIFVAGITDGGTVDFQ